MRPEAFLKNRKRAGREKGFTLVETMVVASISVLVFYAIFIMLRTGSIQANVIGTKLTIEDSAREGLNRMLQEIRETAPARIAIGTNQISFDLAAGTAANGSVVWGDRVTYILGGLNNSQLLRRQASGNGAAAQTVVANNVQSVRFTPNNATRPTLITVQLNVQRQTTQGRLYTDTLSGRGKVRNA